MNILDEIESEEKSRMTYSWWWEWWWLKESNFDVLLICLNTTGDWTTDDLWVVVNEETLSISCISLNLCA